MHEIAQLPDTSCTNTVRVLDAQAELDGANCRYEFVQLGKLQGPTATAARLTKGGAVLSVHRQNGFSSTEALVSIRSGSWTNSSA
jgi:hypothetical protein